MSRFAQGGAEYSGLQNVTARSQGFVNIAPFAAVSAGGLAGVLGGAIEVRLDVTDYQDRSSRRRLEVIPAGGAAAAGESYLVYTGSEGGGMFLGTAFHVSDATLARHWGMMGFSMLNAAADGRLTSERLRDETLNGSRHYVVEVRPGQQETVRYYIGQNDFLISKVVTRARGGPPSRRRAATTARWAA